MPHTQNTLTAIFFIGTIITVLNTITVMFGQDALACGGARPPVARAVERRAVPLIAAIITVSPPVTHAPLRHTAFVVTLEVSGWAGVIVCVHNNQRFQHNND